MSLEAIGHCLVNETKTETTNYLFSDSQSGVLMMKHIKWLNDGQLRC